MPFIASNGPDPPRPQPPPTTGRDPPQKHEKAPHLTVRRLLGPHKLERSGPVAAGRTYCRITGRTDGGVYREQRTHGERLNSTIPLNNSTLRRSRRYPLTHSHNASAHAGTDGPTKPINEPNTTSSSPSTMHSYDPINSPSSGNRARRFPTHPDVAPDTHRHPRRSPRPTYMSTSRRQRSHTVSLPLSLQ